jgi:replicative DNA helicase
MALSNDETRRLKRLNFTQEEINHLEVIRDPALWAETYLRNPQNPRKPLKLRWYQKEMLRCQSMKKVYRLGRRSGKSISLCVEMLWKAFNHEDKMILVCTPYRSQVELLWKDGFMKLIKGNEFIEKSISKMRANPHLIEFHNGSRILGLTAGSSTGNKGSSIKGQSATDLYLDEVDYMGDEAIHSTMAIIATSKNTSFTVSSTPSGKRDFYFHCCTNKNLGYEEFYHPSSDSPEWVSIKEAKERGIPVYESHEYIFRNQYPESVYDREILANFGEEAEGVFKHQFIDRSLLTYDEENSDPEGRYWYCNDDQLPKNIYAMGVDWNGDKVGCQIVITERMREPTTVKYLEEDEKGNIHK